MAGATRQHPIVTPTVEGMYEAARFPIKQGYNPYMVKDGQVVEYSMTGAYYYQLGPAQVTSYGPWRALTLEEIRVLKLEAQRG